MIVDSHVHLEQELPVDRLLDTMDSAGIDRAFLLAAAQDTIPSIPKTGTALLRGCLRVPPLRMPVYRIARNNKRLKPFIRPDNESAEKPPKTTVCGAPIRVHASIAIASSGTIPM